jgi:putative ABC transport system permease protein
MYISVSRDVRFYGMLKTLGTTPEQIQRIVIGQILCLCGVALPIGCLLAAAISLAVVPAVISNSGIDTGPVISFSPLIFIGAATFAALTALLGAITPARKAAQIAPIEALKFTAEYSNKTQYRSSANGKPYKMAFRNIFRNRKRAVIVMLSLFSSTTVFSSIMAIVSSIDVDYLINMEHDYDYILGTKIFEIDHGYSRGMSGDLISTIKSLPGIIETGMTTLEFGELIYSENLAKYVDWLSRTESMSKEYIITRLLGCGFRGIDPLQLRTINKTLLTPIDEEAFERGEFALLNSANANQERFIAMADSLSDVAAFDIKCGGKLGTFQIINGGSVFYRERNINLHYALGGPEFLVSNSFLRKYFPVPGVVYFAMNVEDALDEQIYHEINTLTSPTNVEINSRYAARQAMQDSKTIMMVLGTGVSLILGLIGVLNFVNVMSVSIMTRKREFAALESVGMSKNQMHRMLKNEGAGYAIIVILCAITVGNLIAYGLFILFRNMAEYARFTYPLIPVLIMYAVIIAICLITPGLIYRGISRMTLAERLREAE